MKTLFIFIIAFLCFQDAYSIWKKVTYPSELASFQVIVEDDLYLYGVDIDMLYRSEDGGQTFYVLENNLKSYDSVGAIIELVYENDKLFIVTNPEYHYNFKTQLFYSEDYGETWNRLKLEDEGYSHFKVIDNIYYIYKSLSGVMFSEDFGETWNFLKDGDKELDYKDILRFGDTLILADETPNLGREGKGVVVSYDKGISWTYGMNGLNENGINSIIKMDELLVAATYNGVYKSTNMGEVWRPSSSGLFGESSRVMFLENIEGKLIIGTQNGVFISYDTAQSWQNFNEFYDDRYIAFMKSSKSGLLITANQKNSRNSIIHNLESNSYKILNYSKGISILRLIIDDFVYASTVRNPLYKTSDFENEFEVCSDFFLEFKDSQRLLTKKENILVAQLGGNHSNFQDYNDIIISEDYGETWRFVDLDTSKNYKFIEIFINTDNRIYLFTDLGIIYSDDIGLTWSDFQVSDNLIKNNLNRVAGYLFEADTLYLYGGSSTTGYLYKSDENLSFFEGNILQDGQIYNSAIRQLVKYENHYFAFNNNLNRVVQSSDYGATWSQTSTINRTTSNSLVSDIFNIENNIFVATRFGIYYTTNFGETWEDISFDFSHDILFNNKTFAYSNNKLYLTTNNGIFELDLLEDLNIKLSVIETRNILAQYPPFPQPSNNEVRIRTIWDSVLPLTADDVEIFNINGEKIDVKNKISVENITKNTGYIVWDNSNMQSGIYVMKTVHGTETRITKIMIIK